MFAMTGATGCTQDNPAFDDATSTAATTTDDDPTTSLTSAETESGSEGQEAPEPVCELQPGVPLEIDLGLFGCVGTPESYDRYHPLVSIDGSTLNVGTCPEGAVGCSDQCEVMTPRPLNFVPLDLSTIAAPGDCLHVTARRQNPLNPDVCSFQSVVIEAADANTRRPILIGRNTPGIVLPPVDSASPLVGFEPMLVKVESCSCAEFPADCCEDVEKALYALDIGQLDVVHIGETVPVDFPNNSYEFTTLDASQLGECDPSIQEAWGLIAK
jgi:hypothetical protein